MAKRQVLVHYHFFKNAGTSIDHILESSFGDAWKKFDLDSSGSVISPERLESYILENPQLRAVSSHQAIMPLPNKSIEVHPIVILRHPIERINSCYLFECQKQTGASELSMSLKEYVQEKFNSFRASVIEEYHTLRLANQQYHGRQPNGMYREDELLQFAKKFIDDLPCFGLVEQFYESLIRYKFFFASAFPEFKPYSVKSNVSQKNNLGLSDRLELIRFELGDELYQEVLDRNRMDIEIYEYAVKRFNDPLNTDRDG